MVVADSAASLPPDAISASVAITPGPPPLVRMHRRSPTSGRERARVSTAPNRSSVEYTRSMPARRIAASYTSSAPASAPVCEAAARAPSAARPALITSTGLLRAAARAADMNLRASRMSSMYSRIARVAASLAR